LLGRKVSIRYRTKGDPAHPFSEAIGLVQSVSDTDVVTIVGRRGKVIEVPIGAFIAGKVWS
jgi:hypothetical protein